MTIGTAYAYPQTTIRCLKCGGIVYTQEGVRRMAYHKLSDGRVACKPCVRKMQKSGEMQVEPAATQPAPASAAEPPAIATPAPASAVAAAPSPPTPAPPPVPAYAPPPKEPAPPACAWCGEPPPPPSNLLTVEGSGLRQCAPCLLKAIAAGDDPRRGGMPDDAPLSMNGAFARQLVALARQPPPPPPPVQPPPDYAAALEQSMTPDAPTLAPPAPPVHMPMSAMPAAHLANPGDGYCRVCNREVSGDHHYCPSCYAALPYCGCGRGKKVGYNLATGRHHEVCYACRQDAARQGYYG